MVIPAFANWVWSNYGQEITDRAFGAAKEQWERFKWDAAAQRYRDRLLYNFSTIQVLRQASPIDLSEVFTDVFILEKPAAFRSYNVAYLQKNAFQKQNPDRKDRKNALRVAIEKQTLFIFGKPGAGKTTFLKYLLLKAVEGKIPKIPIFISLRGYAESNKDLKAYIYDQFDICGFPNAAPFVEHILGKEKIGLVLFDGLDEVNEENGQRRLIKKNIEDFTKKYVGNMFLVTCRVAISDYALDKFTYVELADFDDRQINTFAKKWFDSEKRYASFINDINRVENQGLKELARTPLLLTLLCLTYSETGEFPRSKVEFYREAFEALLTKWDSLRGIQRDVYYQQLSLNRKRQLFARIAAETFETGTYFFSEEFLAKKINTFLASLPPSDGYSQDFDGVAVIKAIAAQHGIFVEIANGIYSFSHLTFQEFYTAIYIIQNASGGTFERLISNHLFEERWEEVFNLTASLLDVENADTFFARFKKEITQLSASDARLIAKIRRVNKSAEKHRDEFEGNSAFYRVRQFGHYIINEILPEIEMLFPDIEKLTNNIQVDVGKIWNRIDAHYQRNLTANGLPLRQEIKNLITQARTIDKNIYKAQLIARAYENTLELAPIIDRKNQYAEEPYYKLMICGEVERRLDQARSRLSEILALIEEDYEKLRGRAILPNNFSLHFYDEIDTTVGLVTDLTDLLKQALQFASQVALPEPFMYEQRIQLEQAEMQLNYIFVNRRFVDCLNQATIIGREKIIDELLQAEKD